MIIKWRNKRSGETGYVAGICKSEGHMINSPTKQGAMNYANKGLASAALAVLKDIGEGVNNDFVIE